MPGRHPQLSFQGIVELTGVDAQHACHLEEKHRFDQIAKKSNAPALAVIGTDEPVWFPVRYPTAILAIKIFR